MEFQYRATDERRSSFTFQSAEYNYFTQQPRRASYSVRSSHPLPVFGYSDEYYWNPIEMREAIWRELEKNKIMEGIIAEEVERRLMLEAELRQELMIRRELAMRRGDGFYSPSTLNSVRSEPMELPRPPLPHRAGGRYLDGRVPVSREETLGMSAIPRHEFGNLDSTSFQPQSSSTLRISEISKEERKIVCLAKPEANLSGAKRKALTAPLVDSSDLSSAGGPKKKVKEEWSCALCQVSATSERGLNDHLQGKKHKAKEALLRKNGKNYSVGLCQMDTSKSDKLSPVANKPSLEQGMITILESANSESAKRNIVASLPENKQPYNSVKNKEANGLGKQKTKEIKKKKFKFWCEMCQVGAFAQTVMEAHRTGKKHIARLQVQQNGEAERSMQTLQVKDETSVAEESIKTDGIIEGLS